MVQVNESLLFLMEQSSGINVVKCNIIEAARMLLPTIRGGIPKSAAIMAKESLQRQDVAGTVMVLRPYVAQMSARIGSTIVWDFIDACNFFCDSIGTHWKYLTQPQRERYLKWAHEHACAVKAGIEGSKT